ncbi:hypothetical protein [Lysobacter tyrosinilyticus]
MPGYSTLKLSTMSVGGQRLRASLRCSLDALLRRHRRDDAQAVRT